MDISRDEVRLAGVLERLSGRWRFVKMNDTPDSQPSVVDVEATNEALVLGGSRLDEFAAISPDNRRIPRIEELSPVKSIEPKQMAVILLCGGLGTRSERMIHPLFLEPSLRKTLLYLQLDRLVNSPLQGASLLVLGSLLNEAELRQHLKEISKELPDGPRLYVGGLVPRLTLCQKRSGDPIIYHDKLGYPAYNPAGHFDAVRWLVVGGVLADLHDIEVILIKNYSNWGRIFTDDALLLAAYALDCCSRYEEAPLFVVEVVARSRDKQAGSILVTGPEAPHELRLVKHSYGRGVPRLPEGDMVLMSTNTLYFSVKNLLKRLYDGLSSIKLPKKREVLTRLLEDAKAGRRRDKACKLFDEVFRVEPLLTRKRIAENTEVLQVERDLDQLSLLPGPSGLQAVKVGPEREVSIKLMADLKDPEKLKYLFENR